MKAFRKFILILAAMATLMGSAMAATTNGSLSSKPDTLRILAIGNSFSDDGTMYLPDLLESAGIHNVILGRLYIGGCSLERHVKEYEGNLHDYVYSKSTANKWVSQKGACILDGICDEKWDIISLQQVSGWSGIYDSYKPWLTELIDIVRKNCSNPDVAIVWHQTWSYARTSTHGDFPKYDKDQMKMYESICECVREVKKDYGISVVIPDGTAVQMLRLTRLNDDKDVTRDGFHMSYTYGRYLTACTWFETLIKPTLGISVMKCRWANEGSDNQIPEKDAKLCRQTAVKAVKAAKTLFD